MIFIMETTIKDLLFELFTQYQQDRGDFVSQKEFAQYLNIHKSTLSNLLKGHQPLSKNLAAQFATITGDFRFYDIVGIPRPNIPQNYISLDGLTETQIKIIQEQAQKYRAKNEENNQELPADQPA